MKASASFLIATSTTRTTNTIATLSTATIATKSKQGFLSPNYHPCSTASKAIISARKTTRDVACGAGRAFSSLFFDPAGEMKQPTLYEELVRKLYMIKGKPVKFGLENMEQLHNLMNNPMDRVSPRRFSVCA